MSEQAASEPARPAEKRSWKLAVAVAVLAILPVILPFPFAGLAHLWIGPADNAAWQQCQAFYCPAAAHWDRLAGFLILGPSILVGVASILLGCIGLVRSRRHLTATENDLLFVASVIFGLFWAGIIGYILWFVNTYLAGATL